METDGREKIVRVGSRFILIELFIVIMFAMFYLGIPFPVARHMYGGAKYVACK